MKRIQLFEFEDFEWFPKRIRRGMTNLLVLFHKMMGTKEILLLQLEQMREKYPYSSIVDLGSGSGGIMPDVVQSMNDRNEIPTSLTLTDLHPNQDVIEKFKKVNNPHIQYQEKSLNATQLSDVPLGLKTMINSFHHMPPKAAQEILCNAQKNKEPLFIYEIGENNIPLVLWWILLPISLSILVVMSLVMTLFIKPSLTQLFFTFIIPIIPLCYAWDGQASLVRMYTFNDIESMLSTCKSDDYVWEISKGKKANGKSVGYYILGLPR